MQRIRTDVAEQLRERLEDGRHISRDQHEASARLLVADHLANLNAAGVQIGQTPLSSGLQTRITIAVINSTFGMGRFEDLLAIKNAEDIYVRGCDNVIVVLADGTSFRAPPVADSNEELIRELQHIAANNPAGEAKFSPADPQMDITLPDGSRLSASAWFTPYPTVTIRKHGYVDIDLDELVELGAIDQALAQFLTAAMQAGKSIVVAGVPGSGKTTLVRALLNELDPSVPLATIESNYELHVHELRERHHNVWPAQTRAGGEGGAGAISSQDLVKFSLRQSTAFVVVGEVRGDETLDMLDAMQIGNGSLSTVHGADPEDAVTRLSTMAMRAGEHITPELAYSIVANSVDLIVSIRMLDQTVIGGKKHRFTQAVYTLAPRTEMDGPLYGTGKIFVPGPDGRAIPNPDGTLPAWIDDLVNVGFDTSWLTPGQGRWTKPLNLIATRGRQRDAS
ncbi:CpaF family protein [Ornithinimicrobium murale]|uniref:CpaF family protein n=1 Tax=Ornithinimicrobium murale TaxID=1050153 RepID=UPI000E0DEB1F|nr:type II/IV secretion system ATPase subunit [Ornithinimicrobium murale]